MTDHVEQIRQALSAASQYDEEARRSRRRAGKILHSLRRKHPKQWVRLSGVNQRTGELLIEMATGAGALP